LGQARPSPDPEGCRTYRNQNHPFKFPLSRCRMLS
jgi:hypothetical protein